jgi:acyl dehydratase
LNAAAAVAIGFEGAIVHGMLGASLISRLLGTTLPGPGTIYLSQELRFRRPIYPGIEATASAVIKSVRSDKPVYEIETIVRVGGEIAIEGSATVLLRPMP